MIVLAGALLKESEDLLRMGIKPTEVASGYECGIGLSDFQDLKEGDIIETFDEKQIEIT